MFGIREVVEGGGDCRIVEAIVATSSKRSKEESKAKGSDVVKVTS